MIVAGGATAVAEMGRLVVPEDAPLLGQDLLAPDWVPPEIDTTKAHPARVYDYLLGGKDNFLVDREAANLALRAVPEILDMARENRAFLGRTVRHQARSGVTQFLDIGTGIPGPGHTGEIARAIVPDARVACVDYDPAVVTHSRALLVGAAPEHTAVVLADVRDPDTILDDPAVRATLDFTRPIAVLMVSLLHFVSDAEDPAGIIARFRDAVPTGSALVIAHGTDGGQPERSKASAKGWERATSQVTVRTPQAITKLFEGFDVIEPGIVPIPLWRPDGSVRDDVDAIWVHGGIGVKPLS